MNHPAKLFFSSGHPLFSCLKAEFSEASAQKLSIRFVAQDNFIECEETGRLHSGFCTIILDSVMGGAVMGALGELQPIATVNLTTQHLERPVLGEDILCTADVQRIENQIAVVSGSVIRLNDGVILASAIGSFMIGTRATPFQNNKQDQTAGKSK